MDRQPLVSLVFAGIVATATLASCTPSLVARPAGVTRPVGVTRPATMTTGGPAVVGTGLEPVPRAALCVSEGELSAGSSQALHVDAGGMRAVLANDRSRDAEVEFIYRGPSTTTLPLANGELRRQIGLKLHAMDTCNVIYVMWHVEPTPGIHVSIKQNNGESLHSRCGDGGYTTPRSDFERAVPAMLQHAPNTLRAELDGATLTVTANGTVVWRGQLPAEALSFDGPAGVRSDNGTFDFKLRVPGGASAAGTCPRH